MAGLPNFLRIILAALSFVSFYPQLRKIIDRGDSTGISLTYVFLNLVAATDQFGFSLYMIVDNELMRDTIVASPPNSGNWIDLAQFAFVWLCHLVLFVLVLYYSSLNRVVKATIAIAYLAIIAFEIGSSIELARIRSSGTDVERAYIDFLGALRVVLLNPIATTITAAALLPQLQQMRKGLGLDALSVESLGLQGLVFLLLAFCWQFRMWIPAGLRLPRHGAPWFVAWYQFVGWATVDSLIYAVSQGFLWWRARQLDQRNSAGETEPLLR